jgi:hypothetical protein
MNTCRRLLITLAIAAVLAAPAAAQGIGEGQVIGGVGIKEGGWLPPDTRKDEARRREFAEAEMRAFMRQVCAAPFWARTRTPEEVAKIITRVVEAGVPCVVTDEGAVRPAVQGDRPGPGRAVVNMDKEFGPKERLLKLRHAIFLASPTEDTKR